MFKKLSSSFLIVSACIFSSCTPTVKQEIAILPTPVSLTEQSGSFVLKDGMKIGVSNNILQLKIHIYLTLIGSDFNRRRYDIPKNLLQIPDSRKQGLIGNPNLHSIF